MVLSCTIFSSEIDHLKVQLCVFEMTAWYCVSKANGNLSMKAIYLVPACFREHRTQIFLHIVHVALVL